jgi:hypothetical protein
MRRSSAIQNGVSPKPFRCCRSTMIVSCHAPVFWHRERLSLIWSVSGAPRSQFAEISLCFWRENSYRGGGGAAGRVDPERFSPHSNSNTASLLRMAAVCACISRHWKSVMSAYTAAAMKAPPVQRLIRFCMRTCSFWGARCSATTLSGSLIFCGNTLAEFWA